MRKVLALHAGSLVSGQSSETSAQVTVNTAFQFSQLTWNVTSNGITNASTINLRANRGNAGPTVSIRGSTTGILNDNTDAMNYQVVTALAGTSMKIAFIAVWGNSAVQVIPVTKYKHFRNVPHMKPPFIPNLDIGNQYVRLAYSKLAGDVFRSYLHTLKKKGAKS